MKNLLIILVFAFMPVKGDMLSNHIVIDEQNVVSNFFFKNTTDNMLTSVKIRFSPIDNSLITIDPITIDSIAPNRQKALQAKFVIPDNWHRKTYVVEALITADNFEQHQIVTIYSNAKKGKLKWLGFILAVLVSALFVFIYKKFS